MKSAGDGGHQVPHTLASQEGVALSPSPGLGPAQEVSPELPQLSSVSPKPVFCLFFRKKYLHLFFHLFNVCPKPEPELSWVVPVQHAHQGGGQQHMGHLPPWNWSEQAQQSQAFQQLHKAFLFFVFVRNFDFLVVYTILCILLSPHMSKPLHHRVPQAISLCMGHVPRDLFKHIIKEFPEGRVQTLKIKIIKKCLNKF